MPSVALGMTAFLKAHEVVSGAMNLYVGGETHRIDDSVPLFLAQSGVSNFVPLYVKGDGISAGYAPYDSNMNLVMWRDPAEMVNLFICGPGTAISGDVPLFISAAISQSGSVDFAMPSTVGFVNPTAKLFIRGW